MANFADFVVLRAVPSYGGAEVLRARRVTAGSIDPVVHLGLFGTSSRVEKRLVAVAEASAQLAHDAVARITEVGTHADTLYAVAEAAEGVDLGQILEHEKRKRGVPDASLTIAIVFSLARTVQELHERGDVWEQRAAGLAGLFPAGVRPEAVLMRKDGAVVLRTLAGAVDDAQRPTPFRAPELRGGRSTVASDVFALVQLMRALLAADVNAQSPPRVPTRGGALPTLLVSALSSNPDDRPGLDALLEKLREAFIDNAPNQSPANVIAGALRREYRTLLLDESAREEAAPSDVDLLRKKLRDTKAKTRVMFPSSSSAIPVAELDVSPTVNIPRFEGKSAGSDAVDRVFTEEGSAGESGSGFSIEVVAPTVEIAGKAPRGVLDVAHETLSDDERTQKLMRGALADQASDAGDVPWLSRSDVALISDASSEQPGVASDSRGDEPPGDPEAPAFAAPAFDDDEVHDMHDTVEMMSKADVPKDVSFADVDTDATPREYQAPKDLKKTVVATPSLKRREATPSPRASPAAKTPRR